MNTMISDLIRQITPELFGLLAVILGALCAKLAGVVRAWGLGRRVLVGAQVARERVLALQAEGAIDAELSQVLQDAISAFALNSAQVDRAVADGLAAFGQALQDRK